MIMHAQTSAISGFVSLNHRILCLTLLCMALSIFVAAPAWAQSTNNPSGLPLPRFASTRSAPVNVRVGPGTRYELAWTYVLAGQPVEIIQEFDTWRKIRDADGDTGWVHQNLLSGRRVGLVAPGDKEKRGLRKKAAVDAPVRAWLGAGFNIAIDSCENNWCAVEATASGKGKKTYSGYVPQDRIWGVYPQEHIK